MGLEVQTRSTLALWGFGFTLIFVLITIAAALLAEGLYGRQLADVDPLHGGAELFLTVSNVMILLGFMPKGVNKS